MSKNKRRRKRRQNNQAVLNNAPRNTYACNPIMRKGGVHQQSKSSQRTTARRETNRMARDWASSRFKRSIIAKIYLAFS